MKKKILGLILISLIVALMYSPPIRAWAVSTFYEQIAGTSYTIFLDEAVVTNTLVRPNGIIVFVKSNTNTVADAVYQVDLYLDEVFSSSSNVSWTAGQIPDTVKSINFTGLTLGPVTSWSIKLSR